MLEFGVIIAILVGLAQVFKQMGVPSKFLPALNIILGVVAGIFAFEGATMSEKVIGGLIVGLSASGLYDQSKIITDKK